MNQSLPLIEDGDREDKMDDHYEVEVNVPGHGWIPRDGGSTINLDHARYLVSNSNYAARIVRVTRTVMKPSEYLEDINE